MNLSVALDHCLDVRLVFYITFKFGRFRVVDLLIGLIDGHKWYKKKLKIIIKKKKKRKRDGHKHQ